MIRQAVEFDPGPARVLGSLLFLESPAQEPEVGPAVVRNYEASVLLGGSPRTSDLWLELAECFGAERNGSERERTAGKC